MFKKSIIYGGALAAVLLSWRGDNASAQAPLPPQGTPPAPIGQQQQMPDPEVLEQGPIHEAFAEPLSLEKQQLEIIPKQPPTPVNELPPEEQPEGRNVQWIPGYWMWDQARADFLWVSGMWRDVPPGRKWVPGEWQQVDAGFQWVPGFWADAEQEQIQLLPEPPATLEAGPSSPAPGENYLWAPGTWQYLNNQYVWQAGYWYEGNPNWIWVPNHYSYTPRGYAYVNGYWDYLPYDRGLLYAPVYWGSGYRGGYGNAYWRPRSVINTGLLIANLFVNRGFGHYYYGNYGRNYPGYLHPWGNNYGQWGYRGGNRYGYDPMWAYFRWSNRNGWDNNRWNDRWNNGGPGRNDWDNNWSWDGRGRDRGWDGRPGDRDGRANDGRGPRDGDGRPGANSLVTSVDELAREGRDAIRTRDLSQADINRFRERSEMMSRRGRDLIKDSNVRATTGVEGQVRESQNRGGRGPVGLEGQAVVGADGQIRQGGRNRDQLDGRVGIEGNARVDDTLRGRVGVKGNTQIGRSDGRGPVGGLDLNNQTEVQKRINMGNAERLRGQVEGNVNQQLRGRLSTQNPNMESRTSTRGSQGVQYGDRTRGQVQGNAIPSNTPRGLEGPVQQRVMRLPSGQQVMPQGQNYRSRIEGSPQGNFNRGGGSGRPSISIPQQGGGTQRAIQQAPRSIQRSLPSGGGGGRQSFQGGGGGGRGQAMRSGGGGGRGGEARGGGGGGGRGQGGGGGGGRGRGDR